MQIVHHVGEDLRPGPRITEAIAGSVEGADAGLLCDHGLGFVPDHRPAEYTSHQNDRRAALARAVQVDTPAADIYQLTWLDVGQHSLVLCSGGRLRGPGKDDLTDGKQQGGCQDSAKCERGHDCPLPSRVRHSLSSNARDFRQPKNSFCQLAQPMTGFKSRRVSSEAAMPIQFQLNVRALNDDFTALNSV